LQALRLRVQICHPNNLTNLKLIVDHAPGWATLVWVRNVPLRMCVSSCFGGDFTALDYFKIILNQSKYIISDECDTQRRLVIHTVSTRTTPLRSMHRFHTSIQVLPSMIADGL
jgi:hypothetical protein